MRSRTDNNTLIALITILLLTGCTNIHKREIARQKAEMLMNEIAAGTAINEFPQKYFPPKQLSYLLNELQNPCQFKYRRGNYINNFYVADADKTDKIAFIYEYYLKCDSLRFILVYNLGDTVELFSFNMQKLWEKNPMIINKQRQLKY